MEIREVTGNRKDYLDLLFLADEQEDMIDRYLDKGEMYVLLEDGKPLGEAVVVDLGDTKDGHAFDSSYGCNRSTGTYLENCL